MKAILIHPLDLAAYIQHMGPTMTINHSDQHKFYDELIEINGELFYQTIRAPRVSDEIV